MPGEIAVLYRRRHSSVVLFEVAPQGWADYEWYLFFADNSHDYFKWSYKDTAFTGEVSLEGAGHLWSWPRLLIDFMMKVAAVTGLRFLL